MDVLLTIIYGVLVLVILVVIHEAGHFVAAKGFGVRVTEFMIGLPGPSIGFTHNGTRYGVTAIPLGGYNRITGMEAGPEDPNLGPVLAYAYRHGKVDAEHTALACNISEEDAAFALDVLDEWGSLNAPGRENKTDYYCAPKTDEYELGQAREVVDEKTLLDEERSHTYRSLPCWKRLVVLFAGPLMNIVLAFVLFLVVFCGIGIPAPSTTIAEVMAGAPAAEAGIEAGDTIIAVNGVETPDWGTLSQEIATLQVGQQVEISYMRDGQEATTTLVVGENANGDPQLGVYAGTQSMHLSFSQGVVASWEYFVMTVQAYVSLFNPVTAADTISQSTSVVGISVLAKQSAEAGIIQLLYFIAVISLSLGIVNLVPMPPLDGGKIVVEVIQKIIGREISMRVINAITIVVIALFLLLFVVLLRQDIINFVLPH